MCVKYVFQSKQELREILKSLFKMAETLKTMKESFVFLIFVCVRIEINSHWQ